MELRIPNKVLSIAGRLLMVTAGLAVLVSTIAWLSGMFEPKVEPGWVERNRQLSPDQPTDVVHAVTKVSIEEAVGTLKASSRTIVAAKLLATIDEILVTAGDQVAAGQELIRLDSQEFSARADQARQSLEAAVANREQAQREHSRIRSLLQQKAAARSDFDRSIRDLQVAQANESKAKDAVTEAEVLLSYTTIKAARQGRIVDRLAEPGDVARPGEPILVLYDATSLRLEAPVTERLAVTLRPGDELQVFVDALDRHFDATIDEIVPQADAPTRSFLVKASLPRSEDLYEGMFGRLLIPAGDREHLCLATDAIVRIGQLEFVDVIQPDGTLERRLIKTGQLGLPGRQEVLSGLVAGERVVLHSDEDQTAEQARDQQP